MKILAAISLLIISNIGFSQCPDVLIWSDEFNGTGPPSSTTWGYDLGQSGWGNAEIQNYTANPANVRQEGGSLIIEALKSGSTWTSARVKSQNKKSFTYGKIVFRAKLPTGSGTWPAMWALGNNISSVGWPTCGEIDIMEHVGKNQNVVQAALHTPSSSGNTVNKGSVTIGTASTAFHEYAVSWNADRMIFSVDNIPYYTYNPSPKTSSNWPFNADQFLIMNIAMGGNFGSDPAFETGGQKNGVDPALTSAKMEIDWVRVYEERAAPLIQGSAFLFQNQTGTQYAVPNYGGSATYDWTVPGDATIVSGQGTNQITVNWGLNDGPVSIVTTNTGCANNTSSINVSTIIDPAGPKYLIESFSNPALPGWTKNDGGITYSASSNHLNVTYSLSALKYIQLDMPKAVHMSNYGIIKLPILVPSTSAIPNLLLTFRDGNGNETISTNFEIQITKKDGNFYTYSYNFNGQWSLNNPAVDDNLIKSIRIYMLAGSGSFQVGPIEMYNSTTIPAAPTNLTASITTQGDIALSWTDISNATTFNLYRSDAPSGTYTKIKSNIKTSDVPYVVNPTESLNYYKLTGANSVGESSLSTDVEVIANITGTEADTNSPISVYPNPCNGRFFIQTNGESTKSLKIFDAVGAEKPAEVIMDNQLIIVDLKTIIPGIYFVILTEETKTVVAKILVH